MMHTEEEAKTKWCPFARTATFETQSAVSESAATFNRPWSGSIAQEDCSCIASECMAWRWDGVRGDDDNNDPVVGHCGLAGEPK